MTNTYVTCSAYMRCLFIHIEYTTASSHTTANHWTIFFSIRAQSID